MHLGIPKQLINLEQREFIGANSLTLYKQLYREVATTIVRDLQPWYIYMGTSASIILLVVYMEVSELLINSLC